MAETAEFPGAANIIRIDGLRVEYADGFGLARASNTTPVMVLRFEADNERCAETDPGRIPPGAARIVARPRTAVLMTDRILARPLAGVDWAALKADLAADYFDNGRTPEQMARSFGASYRCVFGRDGQRIVGTGRVISDGVCNAYLVDMWTHSAYRRRGIGRRMLEAAVRGSRRTALYLFTDDAEAFYAACGFAPRGVGMERVVGNWLQNETGQ